MYAQYDIDELVFRVFNNKNSGLFVEAGAAHPFAQSNTAFLEMNGWKGLLIEPDELACVQCRLHRPNSVIERYALVDKAYNKPTIPFGVAQEGLMSGCTTRHLEDHKPDVVPCCTLDSLLKKHNITHVNLLSLDTEGWEHQIIDGIDFNSVIFDLMIIETHNYEYYKTDFKYKTRNFDYVKDYGYIKYKNIITNDENYVIMAHNSFEPKILERA